MWHGQFLLLLLIVPQILAFSKAPQLPKTHAKKATTAVTTAMSSQSSAENEINQVELKLKQAMLKSDVETLDELLDDKLIFTNHLGVTLGKQDDLEAHRQEVVHIRDLTLSDQNIQMLGTTTAIVTVAAHIVGSFLGDPFENTLRFTRVWHKPAPDEGWKVIAAHSSLQQAREEDQREVSQ